ncbi:hypothetical protein [Kineosporia sp. R_H_3]|uniref:hypothetical protein n=1 Tax=Kineosporia sp. R_H_3 TaxID=1961848 RepID=UPI00117A4E2D|nr:hypothetical protein [Kineosporia sp. R_H_3]
MYRGFQNNRRVAVIAVLFALTGCGAAATPADGGSSSTAKQVPAIEPRLENALLACSELPEPAYVSAASDGVTVGDRGASLTLDGHGEDDLPGVGLTTDQIGCVASELRVTDAVVAQMDSTTAMQGRQNATWDGFEASWTYHPDNGLDLIITDTRYTPPS